MTEVVLLWSTERNAQYQTYQAAASWLEPVLWASACLALAFGVFFTD